MVELRCADCGIRYGGPNWADFVIPDEAWERIAPAGVDGGIVLCVSCMIMRANRLGVECVGQFTSGPFADHKWQKPATEGGDGR